MDAKQWRRKYEQAHWRLQQARRARNSTRVLMDNAPTEEVRDHWYKHYHYWFWAVKRRAERCNSMAIEHDEYVPFTA